MDPNSFVHPIRVVSFAHTEYQGHQWYLMACLAFGLLTFCFLIAGLTLGVCGLDTTWLQMRSITGTAKQKKQVRVVIRMKRHASWMLCSLIICSVACSEYFPFIIQDLCGAVEEWVPVVISTLLIAIFAEILPQWLIPRHAVSWGYYCWPLIWGCMWLTAIVSFPLAWLLDNLGAGRKEVLDVFTNEQLGVIIKYHERSERRGGNLSPDATRIILGVLNNDDRKIGREICRIPESSCEVSGNDIENANLIFSRGMIVRWSAVKVIDINEVVDNSFTKKVMSWSYSRIPVVGKPNIERNGKTTSTMSHWQGNQIFGFLHVKNLIGLDVTEPLLVKDLPLYPLPIIRDSMSINELLCMFQLGMSRIAVVVPAATPPNASRLHGTLWTATKRTNARIISRTDGTRKELSNWTTDYLAAAHASIKSLTHKGRHIQGIRSPKPIGIITFEDIIDTLLQRTSRDEKDFFDRETEFPPTKARKAGDCQPASIVQNSPEEEKDANILIERTKQPDSSTLRKRKISRGDGIAGVDGADDQSHGGAPSVPTPGGDILSGPKLRREQIASSSSYTENSRGGFHGTNGSALSDSTPALPSEAISYNSMTSWSNENSRTPFESVTLPSRKLNGVVPPRGADLVGIWRHFSVAPMLSVSPSVSPFSRQNLSIFQGEEDGAKNGQPITPFPSDKPDIVFQALRVEQESVDPAKYVGGHTLGSTGDTISLSSWGGDAVCPEKEIHIFNADTISVFADLKDNNKTTVDNVRSSGRIAGSRSTDQTISVDEMPIQTDARVMKPYDGFPPKLLNSSKENHCPRYVSKTMPRMMEFTGYDSPSCTSSARETLTREKSLHDDTAMLSSQRRALAESAHNGGNRSSSFWF